MTPPPQPCASRGVLRRAAFAKRLTISSCAVVIRDVVRCVPIITRHRYTRREECASGRTRAPLCPLSAMQQGSRHQQARCLFHRTCVVIAVKNAFANDIRTETPVNLNPKGLWQAVVANAAIAAMASACNYRCALSFDRAPSAETIVDDSVAGSQTTPFTIT